MTLSSLRPSGVPQSLASSRLAIQLREGQEKLARLQQQIGSGERFSLPSEAPSDAIRTLTLQRLQEQSTNWQNNIKTNTGFLAASEQALSTVSDALNSAVSLATSGVGDGASPSEKAALADQVQSLLRGVTNAANAKYGGRYLFGGSYAATDPFTTSATGRVRYGGDALANQTFADRSLRVANGLDGATAFGALATVTSTDLNPSLTLGTSLESLNDGRGVTLGSVQITIDNGTPITHRVDLTGAKTVADLKTRIEAAFAADAETVTVDIDPTSSSGLRLTPSAGTIAVSDAAGATTARDLGIRSAAAAQIVGSDLNPQLSLSSTLAGLNGNTGIGAVAGTGLRLEHDGKVTTIDLTGITTIDELFSAIQLADPDLVTGISPDGRGITVSSRLSGAGLSIGENGGTNATLLGLRTFSAATPLAQLNRGSGVLLDANQPLIIQRRDGNSVSIDLSSSGTVQDVLNAINAVDPGVLVASLNTTGNGITLTDSSGAGTLTVEDREAARRLGLVGSSPTGTITGTDVNPVEAPGTFTLLQQLESALRSGNDTELARLLPRLESEANRVGVARAELGSRQQLLGNVENQLADASLSMDEQLSDVFGTDITKALVELTYFQTTLEASLKVAAQTMQLSLLSYL